MFFYHIHTPDYSEWETGVGHLQDAATLVRDTVIASSHHDDIVPFGAGVKTVKGM